MPGNSGGCLTKISLDIRLAIFSTRFKGNRVRDIDTPRRFVASVGMANVLNEEKKQQVLALLSWQASRESDPFEDVGDSRSNLQQTQGCLRKSSNYSQSDLP
jgi:hypothetical protein